MNQSFDSFNFYDKIWYLKSNEFSMSFGKSYMFGTENKENFLIEDNSLAKNLEINQDNGKKEIISNFKNNLKKKKYKTFSNKEKLACIKLVNEIGFEKTALFYNVSIKTLKRWVTKGIKEKRSGRKIKDPEMEKKLIQWYKKKIEAGIKVSAKDIKEKALQFTKINKFKASKGWLDRLKNRHNLKISKEN